MPPESATGVLNAVHAGLRDTVHVGVLVPWANTVVETEFPRLGLDRVVFHYARLVPASGTTSLDDRFLRDLTATVPTGLRALSRLPLARTLLACTSAGFTREDGFSLPVPSAFDALVSTLRRMSIERVVLVAPYPARFTALEARAFHAQEITVLAHASLDRDDGYAQVSRTELRNLLAQLSRADLSHAQAIILSCTGWPTLDLLAELEEEFGMVALSSNLALAVHAMTNGSTGAKS